jgi:hypothetical protein
MLLVFFVSAVFHEVAVGVPLHMVRFHAFAGIMLQVSQGSATIPKCDISNCCGIQGDFMHISYSSNLLHWTSVSIAVPFEKVLQAEDLF